jgi:hypothetical protein
MALAMIAAANKCALPAGAMESPDQRNDRESLIAWSDPTPVHAMGRLIGR